VKIDDARELNALGYAQELFRTMGGFSNFAISFSIISILTGAVTLYSHGLVMGGPAEMAFGWPLVSFFTLMVALSMAELASAMPTSGAMYHWATLIGGNGWGWFTAWFYIVGQLATLAGIDYGCAMFVTPLVGLPTTGGVVLAVYAAVLLSHAVINHVGIRLVARLNDISVTVHVVGVLAIVAAVLLFAPKQPIGFFFTRVTSNTEGWPYWWAFVIGLLQAQWTFTGYDASASVSEETVDPRRRAPWGIVMAVVVSAVFGYLLLMALTLAIRDLPSVLNARDAGGHEIPAVIAILTTALGERAGGAVTALAAAAMWFCGLSAVTWTSRVIFAFARDGGMPASAIWRRVSATHRTPAPAIWLSAAVAFIATIGSGSYAIVTSISVIGLYVSYIIPVCLLWRARGSAAAIEPGPWHLGRYGSLINLIAIVWVLFISVILAIPDGFRAGKTVVALTIALALWYALAEKRRFRGPAWMVGREREAHVQKLVLAAVAVGLFGSQLSAQSTGRSIQGAWRVEEATIGGPAARTISFADRPNLTIITDKHYSRVEIQADGPRPTLADPAQATADQLRAVWGPVVAEAGTYELTSDGGVMMRPVASKNPAVMGSGVFIVYSYTLEGDTLVLTQRRNQNGPFPYPFTLRLRRVE
jgi:amino acid transporter